MDEDSADDDEFAHVALCICSAAEHLNASEDDLAHLQVSTGTSANRCCHCGANVHCSVYCSFCLLCVTLVHSSRPVDA